MDVACAAVEQAQGRRDHIPEGVLHAADGVESHQLVARKVLVT